jgi:hypothetical protein
MLALVATVLPCVLSLQFTSRIFIGAGQHVLNRPQLSTVSRQDQAYRIHQPQNALTLISPSKLQSWMINATYDLRLAGHATEATSSIESLSRAKQEAEPALIESRTKDCLDLPSLLTVLQSMASTILGQALVAKKIAVDAEEARMQYRLLEQLQSQLPLWPLTSNLNMWPVLYSIEMNSAFPQKDEIAHFALDLGELTQLKTFIDKNIDKLSLFSGISERLTLPWELVEVFDQAFDEEGNLSPIKYPQLKSLLAQIKSLQISIIRTLQGILQSDQMKEKVADQ